MSADAPRWAAVVVNYESGDLLAECVDALRADDSAGPVEIVVVDNGSTDGSVRTLRTAASRRDRDGAARQPRVRTRAANLGIAATRAPFVLVCNPDTTLAPGSAGAVLDVFAADPDVAVVGPHIVNPDGSTYPSARTAPGTGVAVGHALLGRIAPHNRFTPGVPPDRRRHRPVTGRRLGVGRCALVPARGALDRVGGWDERYFMFLEDVDVCRAITAAGRAGALRAGCDRGARRRREPRRTRRSARSSTTTGPPTATSTSGGPVRAGMALPAAAAFLSVAGTRAPPCGRGDRAGPRPPSRHRPESAPAGPGGCRPPARAQGSGRPTR